MKHWVEYPVAIVPAPEGAAMNRTKAACAACLMQGTKVPFVLVSAAPSGTGHQASRFCTKRFIRRIRFHNYVDSCRASA
jgi:hypothetical protein